MEPIPYPDKEDIKAALLSVLSAYCPLQEYTETFARQLASEIPSACLKRFAELKLPFRYIVNCTVIEKDKCGKMNEQCVGWLWDSERDFTLTEMLEMPTYSCVIDTYAVSFFED